MPTKTTRRDAAMLRRRAEVLAATVRDPGDLSPDEIRRVLHELQVHQVELEMQNDELRRTQLELDRARLRYLDLYDQAPAGYVTLNEQGNIREANLKAGALLGMAPGELAGRPLASFILRPDSDDFYRLHRQLFLTGRPQACDVRLATRDDAAANTWVRLELSLVAYEEQLANTSRAILTDITELKRAEETLHAANAEMQRVLQLKDEFLASMSHELRTPLSAILGLSEALTEQIGGPLNDKQQRYVQIITESAHHLLELINAILDLARINAGKMELDLAEVEVAAVAQASLQMIRELATKKGQQLVFEMDAGVGHVMADPRRLRQMLVNLLSNAVKFTPDGGQIGLEVSGDAQSRILSFTVRDTGIGINQADLPRLFQPFVQLNGGLTRPAAGSGLGLALVSQMAALLGGGVTAESEPGKGSRFTVSIPWLTAPRAGSRGLAGSPSRAAQAQVQSPAGRATAPRAGEPWAKVLIVDDSEVSTLVMRDYLGARGYDVLTARDGFEGIAQAAESRPDVILLDVMMPGLDGIGTARRLRALPDLAHTPVIALTALVMPGDRERCLQAGMNEYLSKPVELAHLVQVIERHLAP